MATTSRDQPQLDLASHLVCAVSLNLQQRPHQPRNTRFAPSGVCAAEPLPSVCRSNANASSCLPLVKQGSTSSSISSNGAVRRGSQLGTARGPADLLADSSAPRVGVVAGLAASCATSNTAQRPSGADLSKGYRCNPARRLSGFEILEQEQEGTCAEQQRVIPKLGPAEYVEESSKHSHPNTVRFPRKITFVRYQVSGTCYHTERKYKGCL